MPPLIVYCQVTTRVSKPVDIPPPTKKARTLAGTPRSKPARPSVPWINGALCTPAPSDDALVEVEEENEEESVMVEPNAYQQVCDLRHLFLFVFLFVSCCFC